LSIYLFIFNSIYILCICVRVYKGNWYHSCLHIYIYIYYIYHVYVYALHSILYIIIHARTHIKERCTCHVHIINIHPISYLQILVNGMHCFWTTAGNRKGVWRKVLLCHAWHQWTPQASAHDTQSGCAWRAIMMPIVLSQPISCRRKMLY